MLIIYTSDGKEIVIDDDDYLWLTKYSWRLDKDGYAIRSTKNRNIHMARFILGLDIHNPGIADHIDGNRLNNSRSNLRIVTRQQNSMNRGKYAKATSIYKGVTWHAQAKRWQAMCSGKYLGLFKSERDAASAYNDHASKLFGEFNRKIEL